MLDGSGSKENFEIVKKFATEIAKRFRISSKSTHAGVITIGGENAQHDINLRAHADINSFIIALKSIPHRGSVYNMEGAMEIAQHEFFSPKFGARTEARRQLIVVTDGSKTNDQYSGNIGDEMRKDGVRIITVGVGVGLDKYVLRHVTGGSSEVYVAHSFESLLTDDFIRKILKATCIPLGW